MFKVQEAQSFNPKQLQELKRLVARGEGLTLEFKRKVAFLEKIAKEFVRVFEDPQTKSSKSLELRKTKPVAGGPLIWGIIGKYSCNSIDGAKK